MPSQIPKTELTFIRDQITKIGSKGTMQIGGKDEAESKRIEKSLKRKADVEAAAAAAEEKKKREEEDLRLRAEAFTRETEDDDALEEDDAHEDKSENKDDPDFLHDATDRKLKKTTQNRTKYPMTALQIARCNMPPPQAAFVMTAVLCNIGVITQDDKSWVTIILAIDRPSAEVNQDDSLRFCT